METAIMKNRDSEKLEKELRTHKKEYEQIKAEIQKISFICKGTINERCIPCGNPGCACHKDPKKRHGPYYQLSWKEDGKTMSHYIPPENVDLYTQWIENRHVLMNLIDKMEAVSRKVGELIRAKGKQKRQTQKLQKNSEKSKG
jgi:hypothetical protein